MEETEVWTELQEAVCPTARSALRCYVTTGGGANPDLLQSGCYKGLTLASVVSHRETAVPWRSGP